MKEKIYLMLLSSIILAITLVWQVSAESPIINVDPLSIEVDIGETFTVNVNITDVEAPGVYAFELKVYYNNTLLNATGASYPSNHFLSGSSTFTVPPIIDREHGYVQVGATLLGEEPGRTGSGVFATIEFSGIAAGVSLLEVKDVTLLDPDGKDIQSSANNGEVIVIPEFSQMLILILMFTTLAVIALKKFATPKKSKPTIP